jgi:type I restriction enzyme S subunit
MIPPGYKQTEVGVIPEEWQVKCLREVATIATGNTPPTSDASNYGDEFPFVGPVDLGDAKLISKTEKMLSKKGFAMSRRFPKDSILFVSIGSTIGKCGIAPVELTSNQQINAIFPSTSFSADYLFYAVSAAAPRIKAQAGEQAVPIVNKTQFSETSVALPPLPEQRAIATALSDVDALLAALDRLIAKQRDLKQAAMQQLLTGQTRLPGFKGKWETKRLGDVGTCIRGVSYQGDSDLSSHDTAHTKRLLRSNNVQESTIVISDVQFVNAARVSEKQILRKNDILICMANGSKALVGKAGLFSLDDGYVYTFGAFMGCFRNNSDTSNSAFVFYLFQTGRYRDYINNLLAGSSINNLSPGSIESLEFSMPPLPEQTAIATVLSDMDLELAALEQRRDKTRALKQGMMQELLTGRTRLV